MKNADKHPALKKLERHHAELTTQITNKSAALERLRAELEILEKKRCEIAGQIAAWTPPLTVTEHALVRFLERAMKIDLDAVRKQIVTDALRNQHKTLGDGQYGFAYDGRNYRAVVRGCAIVSIVPGGNA